MFIDFFVRFIVIIALFAGCTYFFISYNNKKNGRFIESKMVLALVVFAVIMIKLRLGYSFICWIIGIGCYVGVIFFFSCLGKLPDEYDVYTWYFYAGFPLIIALLTIIVLFRPLYIISACRIYINYACDEGIQPNLPKKSSVVGRNILVIFMLLTLAICIVLFFHQQLGIDKLLAVK